MTMRETLIDEIKRAPDELLPNLLSYLRREIKRRQPNREIAAPAIKGAYADYWNQFIGAFANEEWERPPQDPVEKRNEWPD